MIRDIINKFGTTLYVQIWENRIKVSDVMTSKVFDEKPLVELGASKKNVTPVVAFGNEAGINAINPFSHPRVLFSDFNVGEKLLQLIFNKILGGHFFSPSPAVVIHPMEKTEGGLTLIEIRAFRELGLGAGARDVVVYQGKPLHLETINFKKLSEEHDNQKNSDGSVVA